MIWIRTFFICAVEIVDSQRERNSSKLRYIETNVKVFAFQRIWFSDSLMTELEKLSIQIFHNDWRAKIGELTDLSHCSFYF